MSAETCTWSPTTRLIGQCPSSISGWTSSMAMAGYVSSGGTPDVVAGAAAREVAGRRAGVARRAGRLAVRPEPSAPFGNWAGLVLAFRVRARRLLPFEGVESIPLIRPQAGTERATNVTG